MRVWAAFRGDSRGAAIFKETPSVMWTPVLDVDEWSVYALTFLLTEGSDATHSVGGLGGRGGRIGLDSREEKK